MPTIPGGAGAAVALLAALVLCGGGDLTAAELTSFSLLTEAGPSPYSCLSQAYPEQYPTALEEPLEVQFVESSEECMDKESTTLSLANLENVDGKVVVYRMCSKAASRSEYYLDYFFKAFRLEEQGAVMVIPVEAWDSKLPEHMDRGELTETLSIPVCIMEKPMAVALLRELEDDPSTRADLSALPFYNSALEPRLDSPITKLKITVDSTHDLTLPIGTSTFNPETSVAVTGTLLPLELRPECYQTPAEDWGRCVSCWSSGRIGNQNGPVLNHNEIITASTGPGQHVLFVGLEGQGAIKAHNNTCFSFFYSWAVFGERLMTDAVLIGGRSDTRLAIAGPNLVGAEVVPTFNTINMHSNTLSNMLSDQKLHNNITLQVELPALEGQQGPPFYAPVETEPGLTALGFWDDSLSDVDVRVRHFECLAGQATFNPQSHPGSPAPLITGAGTVMPGSGRRLLYVKPSVDCADSATCGRCMDAPTGKLDLDPDQSYADVVILLHEDDFPCFQRHSEFSQAAIEAAPFALIVAQLGGARHSVVDTEQPRLAFPTFAVTKECGSRVVENCDPDGDDKLCPDTVYVQLPGITAGVAATYSTSRSEAADEEAYIQFTSPVALSNDGPVSVGQSNFNPRDHPHVNAAVVVAKTLDICNAQETCLACDRTQWRWKQPPELFAGQVAVFSQVVIDDDRVNVQDVDGEYMFQFRGTITQGGCLLPWSNIVKDLQDAGALAVIFINRDQNIRTYVQEGVPPGEVNIPSFNLPLSLGMRLLLYEYMSEREFLGDEFRNGAQVIVRLPRLAGGVADQTDPVIVDQQQDVAGPSTGRVEANDLAGSELLLPVWAIAVAAVGGVLFLCGVGCLAYFVRRKRRMFAYNQMDSAVQADMMADIMSMPANGDDGFQNEPLGGEDSDSDPGTGTQAGGGMQMVELGGAGRAHNGASK